MVIFLSILFLYSPPVASAQDCPKGSAWVRPHPRDQYYRSDGVYVSATDVTGHCRSKTKSYDFWSALLVNGRPKDWVFNEEKSSDWTSAEISQFIKAAEKLPTLLRNKVNVFRMKKSKDIENPATSTKGVMVLYDSAFSGKDILSRILIHELAHEFYRKMPNAQKDKFHKDMGWVWLSSKPYVETEGLWKGSRSKYVTRDSDTSPEEDFANGIEYYLFESTRLKFMDPKMHQWIKSKYGDKLRLE